MPYPSFVTGETLPASALNSIVASVSTAQARADAAYQLIPGGGGATPGGVALDSFTGANDDAKLTAALSYAAAQTIKPHIFFSNRLYTFSQANRAVYSGMKLVGLGGHGDQQRGANSIPNDIRYQGTGTWWVCPAGSTFDVFIGGLCFQGNSSSQFMSCNPGVLWTSVFRDLGFNLWKNVLGTPATKFLITAVLFDGWWNTNNGYGTAYTLGGSDSNLWMDGGLLDSQTAFMPSSQYHLELQSLQKSTIGPIYCTAQTCSGMRISGGQTSGGLILMGNGRMEGRNAGAPCVGSNIRIDGSGVTIRDWSVNFGATGLNTTGHTGEGGLITVTGGEVVLDGLWYDRATGVDETVPLIYQTGGNIRVSNMMRGFNGGAWAGKPRFRTLGGSYNADNSVALVTV